MISFLKRALLGNLLLKFAALVCAVVLWVYVDSAISTVRVVEVKARFGRSKMILPFCDYTILSRGAEHSLGTPPKVNVSITVRGPKPYVDMMQPGDIRAYYLMPESATEGDVSLRRDDLTVILPRGKGLSLLRVEPGEIRVRVTPKGDGTKSGVP